MTIIPKDDGHQQQKEDPSASERRELGQTDQVYLQPCGSMLLHSFHLAVGSWRAVVRIMRLPWDVLMRDTRATLFLNG